MEFYHHDREKNELLRTSDALKDNRIEIAAFFADHPDSRERGDFVKSFFDNTFVEKIMENGQRARLEMDILQGVYRYNDSYYHYGEVSELFQVLGITQWPEEVQQEYYGYLTYS